MLCTGIFVFFFLLYYVDLYKNYNIKYYKNWLPFRAWYFEIKNNNKEEDIVLREMVKEYMKPMKKYYKKTRKQ